MQGFIRLVMDTEIELKLLTPKGIKIEALLALIEQLPCTCKTSQFTLFNQYFDTPDNALSRFGIGLRIRSSELGIEQTVKLPGSSVGGLHQRPEYNIRIEKLEPELELFDPGIWPVGLDVSAIQQQISQVFSTDFSRKIFHLTFDNQTEIELVYDEGEISASGHTTDIREIELEVKQGGAQALFELAYEIAALAPTQLGNLSKAARGFLLARNALAPKRQPMHFVKVEPQDSCEDAFTKALSYSLEVWQDAEYRYMQSSKIVDLREIHTGMRLALEALDMYSSVLACDDFPALQQSLRTKLRSWAWIDQVTSMKALRSKRGPFSKKLAQHDALISYMRGLQDGILNLSRPQWLITHQDNTQLQIKLLSLMFTQPWKNNHEQQHELPVTDFAQGNLKEIWGPVREHIGTSIMSAADYLQSMDRLRSALFRGVFVGNVFSASRRDPYRAPWLDILDGMVELRTISVLQSKLQDSDVEDKSELLNWSDTKQNNLLAVMEQSKAIALTLDPYW